MSDERPPWQIILAEHIEAAFDRMAHAEMQRPPCTHSTLPLGATCPGCRRTPAQIEGAERREEAEYRVPSWAPKLTNGRMPRG